ncbi:MAG: peptidylprolyl isomerase [Rubripirellula sp.]
MIWLARSCFSAVLLVWAVLASSVPLSAVAQEPGTQEPGTQEPGTQQSNSASSTPKSASTGAIEQLSPATNVSPTVPASQTDAPIPPVATGAPAAAGLVPTAGVQGTGSEAEASDDLTPEQYREELLKDPEYVAELDKRAAAYKKSRANLVKAVGDQRETFVRYLNHDVRTPAARQLFFEQREVVQNRLDDHYNTALALTMMGEYNEDAITFLVTMIQHRFENSIYDIATLQGATFLMDNNSQLEYIWKAAARSAVTTGQFDTARKIYEILKKPEVLGDKEFNETDGALSFFLDEHEKQFNEEMEIRKQEQEETGNMLPRVNLKTTQGDVEVELYINQAPSAVSHFIKLVESGFYDGLDFQLVIQDMLALTGDPNGDGLGNSGHFLKDEHQREGARHGLRGSLLMAKIPKDESGNFFPDSGSSQFTILLLPLVSASEKQTVFGRVTKGMNAISRLRRIDPNKKKEKGEIVQPPDSIIEATVLWRPKTLPEPVYADPTETRQR